MIKIRIMIMIKIRIRGGTDKHTENRPKHGKTRQKSMGGWV